MYLSCLVYKMFCVIIQKSIWVYLHTPFLLCPQILGQLELKSGLVSGLLCCSYLVVSWRVPFGKPKFDSWLMSWDVASMFPSHVLSAWCHLFCEMRQSLQQQHLVMSRLYFSFLFLLSNVTMITLDKHQFHQTTRRVSTCWGVHLNVDLQIAKLFMLLSGRWLLLQWLFVQPMSACDPFYCG